MILREMAESLKRISDRQEDIYKAIAPLTKIAGTIAQRQTFDKTVLNGLMNLAKFDLDCLEDESKVRHVEGNIHLLKHRGVENTDIKDYFVARDLLNDLPTSAIDAQVGKALEPIIAGVLSSVRQECIASVSKMNSVMNDMLIAKKREITSTVASVKRDVEAAYTAINEATKEAKDLVLTIAKSEISDLKNHREEEINSLISKINKSIATLSAKIYESNALGENIDRTINGYSFMTKVFDEKLIEVLTLAEQRVSEEQERMNTQINQAVKGVEDRFENYLSQVKHLPEKFDKTFDAEIRPEIGVITKKLTDKIEDLENTKKEIEMLASSMSDIILRSERTVAQVGNFIPNRERKVFINGKRNN